MFIPKIWSSALCEASALGEGIKSLPDVFLILYVMQDNDDAS